jgi:hypothetical protein
MVNAFGLKATLTWGDIVRRLTTYCGLFDDADEAYHWFRSFSDEFDELTEDGLSAKAFDLALQRLKIPELERKILWAEMDTDVNGVVSMTEFHRNIVIEGDLQFAISCEDPCEDIGNSPSMTSMRVPEGRRRSFSSAQAFDMPLPRRVTAHGPGRRSSFSHIPLAEATVDEVMAELKLRCSAGERHASERHAGPPMRSTLSLPVRSAGGAAGGAQAEGTPG